jgi:hypothetical protein
MPNLLPSFRNPIIRNLCALSLFVLLTLPAFHPLPWQAGSKTIGGKTDNYIFLWDLWWVQYSLVELHQWPLHTDFIFPPTGCSLAYHTLCLGNGLLGLLFGSTVNILLAHNILLMLSFALAGFFTFLLVRELTGSTAGALAGGIIFAFSQPKWTAVFHGQMNISTTQWIPLFLFFLVNSLKRPRWYWSLGLCFSLIATLYTSYQQVVFLVLLTLFLAPFVLYREWRHLTRHPRAAARNGVIIALVTIILASPLLFELATNHQEAVVSMPPSATGNMCIQFDRLVSHQTFRRGWIEAVSWGPARNPMLSIGHVLPAKGPMYGFVVSFLLLLGWLLLPFRKKHRGAIIYWTLAAIPVTWLMMGLRPKVYGVSVPSLVPFVLELLGFSAVRTMYRYSIPLTLLVAILTGFVMAATFRTRQDQEKKPVGPTARRLRQAGKALCITLVVGLPFFEYLKAPLRVVDLPQPPAVYLQDGLGPDDNAVILELPYWCSGGDFWIGSSRYETLYFQSLHNRKMVGGHHSRLGKAVVSQSVFNRTLHYLSNVEFSDLAAPTAENVRNTFRTMGIRHVNITRGLYRPEDEQQLVSFLEDTLDAQLIAEETRFLTYRIPPP